MIVIQVMESSEDLIQEFWVSAKRFLAHQISLVQKVNQSLKPGIHYERRRESSNLSTDSAEEISFF